MTNKLQRYAYTIPWNLLLITIGSVIFGIGMKAIAVPPRVDLRGHLGPQPA